MAADYAVCNDLRHAYALLDLHADGEFAESEVAMDVAPDTGDTWLNTAEDNFLIIARNLFRYAPRGEGPEGELISRISASLEEWSSDLSEESEEPKDFGDLFEKLIVANVKLYDVCNRKAQAVEEKNYERALDACGQDIELCKYRGALKKEINKLLGGLSGDGVKNYG